MIEVEVYLYLVELQDFLFYAQEAVAGTVTSRWLHATAINYALAYTKNVIPEKQPYVMFSEYGRNVPGYESSFIPEAGFYATAACVENPGTLRFRTFLVKGDPEGFGYVTGRGAEVLRVSRVSMLPPGTTLRGFVISREAQDFPSRIRLGRFRTPAYMRMIRAKNISLLQEENVVSHPVDPLVTTVKKGVLVPILPYPLVDKACTERCWVAVFDDGVYYVALPDMW